MNRFFLNIFLLTAFTGSSFAQEQLKALNGNPNLIYSDLSLETRSEVISSQKTQSLSITLPFIEDFYYAPVNAKPDQNKWSDWKVYVNSGYPINPPSIGVATFDGLNENGYPYYPGTTGNSPLGSDTLTSREINLFTTANSQTLQPSDSVALSFYYQARGNGDSPEVADALELDFYKPSQGTWTNTIWSASGNVNNNVNDTVFKRGFVWISDTAYLKDGFKFRFRNKSAANGNYDHWHLDYVYLNKDRSAKADTVYEDLTFGYVPTPFLRDYSAMPWNQYTAAEMAPSNLVKIKNNGVAPINMTYEYKINSPTQQLYAYSGGAFVLDPFKKKYYDSLAKHATPPINYTFAPLPDTLEFKIKHYVFRSGSSTDFIKENDTVIQTQKFSNYYALDDGGAEAGYYVNAAGGKIAIKVNVNVADSFLGMRIYFDPVETVNSQSNSLGFRIVVWAPGTNGPSNIVLFRDTIFKPKYYNTAPEFAFAEFKLLRQKYLAAGTYYMGIQQLADFVTVGFDVNTDHSATTYYDAGAGWKPSAEKGSVMIRPIFGKTLPRYLGVDELKGRQGKFSIYPNPANTLLTISSDGSEKAAWSLLNALGQVVDASATIDNFHQVNTANLPNGIYLLVLKTNNYPVQQQKIIIQH